MYRILLFFTLFQLGHGIASVFSVRLRPPQNFGVQGTLLCNDKPMENVVVKLCDNDSKSKQYVEDVKL